MPSKTSPVKLKTVLGLAFGIAVGIGGTIGVGILRNPGTIAGLLHSGWLILLCWGIGGLYILLSVGTIAELSAMLPKAGGPYNYVKLAFGNFAGFFVGWFDYIMNAIAPAYFCIVIGEYVVLLFPSFFGYEKIIALATLMIFTLIHSGSVRNGSFLQQLSSFLKLLVFIILIIALFSYSSSPVNTGSAVPSSHLLQGGLILGFFKSLQLILGTYDGWMGACFFAEEDRNPGRNIPRSLFAGAVIVIMIYLLVNAAFLYVLPVEAMRNSPLVASDAAQVVFGANGARLVTIISVISLISILNVYMMIPSRILFGLSRDKFFFDFGSRVNKGGTPLYALLISSFFSLILIVIGSFGILFSLATFISLIVLGGSYFSLIRLRQTQPQMIRPFKVFAYPWSTWLLIIVTAALFIGFAIADVKSFIAIIVISILSFGIFKVFIARQTSAES